MKYTLLILTAALVLCSCGEKTEDLNSITFDQEKAERYGADDYGMKTYVMAFLKVGPKRPEDSATAARLQRAHLDNINRLAEAGMLVVAGPFMGNDSLRGIYIFDTDNLQEAASLVETDPAIQSESLVMDLRLWYGSAALMEVNEIHESIAKISI